MRMGRAGKYAGPISVAAATTLALGYLYAVDPNEPGHYPACPTKALTGWDCPLCGGLRCTHALVNGDLAGAVNHNAFITVVLFPLALIAFGVWIWRIARPTARPVTAPAWLMPSLLATMIVFSVVRNIPGVPFNSA